jgi:hypothetical protein
MTTNEIALLDMTVEEAQTKHNQLSIEITAWCNALAVTGNA